MKRWIATMLCMCMLFSAGSIHAAKINVDKVVAELREFTSEDRANLVAIALPMILTDSGLDLATDLIKNYNPLSNSLYNRLLHPVFRIITQDEALVMVEQMYKIDESVRSKYFEGFQNRTEAKLTPGSQAIIDKFFYAEIAEVAGLEQICREDGITPGVLAHFCGLFVELNGNVALFTDANESDFAVNSVSPLLNEMMFEVSEGKYTAHQYASKLANKLNQRYSALEKQQLKKAFKEIGLYTPSALYAGSGLIGGGVIEDTQSQYTNGFGYKVISRSLTDGDVVEVGYYENGVLTTDKIVSEAFEIAIPVNTANVMLYYEGERSEAVKFTAYANGMLYCRIDKLGTYKLYSVEPYFVDANGWGKDYIEALFRRGIISGKSAGVFAPEAQITREEFVKLAVELFGLTDPTLVCDFVDVPAGAWYAPYLASAKKHGIVNGVSADRFGVGAPITRQDMCKILYGMLDEMNLTENADLAALTFHDADAIAPYAMEAVQTLVHLGIINGDDTGNFNPMANATRQEAAKLIYGMLLLYVQ